MNLELSAEERGLLAELLDEAVRDLKEEIYKTETFDYKEQLKTREQLMLGLLQKVNAAPAV